MIRSFRDKRLIYCADAGLGSMDIRRFNSFGSRNFTTHLKITHSKSSNNKPKTLKEMREFDRMDESNRLLYDDVVYKVIPADKAIDLGFTEEYETSCGNTKRRSPKES